MALVNTASAPAAQHTNAALGDHTVTVAVLKRHIVRAITVVGTNLARVKLSTPLALRLNLHPLTQLIIVVTATATTTTTLDVTLRHCTIHIAILKLHIISAIFVVPHDLARIVLDAPLALRFNLSPSFKLHSPTSTTATAKIIIESSPTATTTCWLDATFGYHAISIAIVELNIESTI